MRVNKVHYWNFYSSKDITVDFDEYEGITIIDGENGAGKSTIFEAVSYAITGRTIRKSTEKSMVNNAVGKDCGVEIWIDGNKYIRRTRKPTSLQFLVGDDDLTQEDARRTQQEIERVLNINYKTMMCAMVFGQHSTEDFLSANKDDKRSIIKNFLNLEEIFDLRDKIKDFKSEYSNAKKAAEVALSENESQIDDVEARLENLRSDIELPDMSLSEIIEAEEEYTRLVGEGACILHDIVKAQKHLSQAEDIIEGGPRSIESECDQCGHVSLEEVDDKTIESARETYGFYQKHKKSLEKQHDAILKEAAQAKPAISSMEYSDREEAIQEYRLRETLVNQLDTLRDRREEIRQEQLKAVSSYEVMRFWEKAFSEQGLIRYIIRNVLSTFNDKCNTYLYTLSNGKYYIEFDDQLDEKIWTEKKVIYHEALSGGEKRKINLAVMLALQDLLSLTDSNKTDLLFFDEIGENLDAEGMYGLYILLQQIQREGKKVFLITHNEQMKNLLDSYKRIVVKKEKGITTIDDN